MSTALNPINGPADLHEEQTAERRTAALAFAIALPGLGLVALACATSRSLALTVDLILTAFDAAALGAVLWVALRVHGGPGRARAERRVAAAVAVAMSLAIICTGCGAVLAIAAGGSIASGPGVALGLGLNAVQGMLNLWLLGLWRRRQGSAPSLMTQSQVALFSDKLATNTLVCLALAVGLWGGDLPLARHADPLAAMLIALATLRFTLPLVAALISQKEGEDAHRQFSVCGREREGT